MDFACVVVDAMGAVDVTIMKGVMKDAGSRRGELYGATKLVSELRSERRIAHPRRQYQASARMEIGPNRERNGPVVEGNVARWGGGRGVQVEERSQSDRR